MKYAGDWQSEAKKLHAAGMSIGQISMQLGIDPGFLTALLKPELKHKGFKPPKRRRFQRRK